MRTPTRDRRSQVLGFLRHGEVISVRALSEQLGVSELTIRRDLDILQNDGLVERLHGGVRMLQSTIRDMDKREISFYLRLDNHVEEKQAIAQAALQFVRPDEILFMDASTTCLYLVQAIPQDMAVTIVTYSAYLPIELAGRTKLQVICTGGTFHPTSLCYLGPEAEDRLRKLNSHIAFMGVKGITAVEGCTDANLADVQLKGIVADQTRELIILADHTKIGNIGLSSFARISQVRALITDDGAKPEAVARLRDAGLNVILAPVAGTNGNH